jgi:hypothetical protein
MAAGRSREGPSGRYFHWAEAQPQPLKPAYRFWAHDSPLLSLGHSSLLSSRCTRSSLLGCSLPSIVPHALLHVNHDLCACRRLTFVREPKLSDPQTSPGASDPAPRCKEPNTQFSANIKIDLFARSRGKDTMAPAPGSGHSEDDGPQTSAPTPTMTSQDIHQNAASAPTPPPPSSYPPMPTSWYGGNWPGSLSPYPIATDAKGMVIVILIDGEGRSVWQYSTLGSQYGVPSTTAPYPDMSSTSFYRTSSPASSSTGSTPQFPSSEQPDQGNHHGPPLPAQVALGIIIPCVLILLSICAFVFCIRSRKKKSDAPSEETAMAAARKVPEMKSTGVGGGPAMHSAQAAGGPACASGAVMSPLTSPSSTSSAATATPPVILSTTMNDAYYTGIDTSDHISLTDQRSEASADTFGEEPPPPYRPRSVPPISRETSVRNSICRNSSVRSSRHDPMSGSNLMGSHVRRSVDVRSPFDDPEDSDDDNLSQISTIRSLHRRDTDRLSVVSDTSYQEEPTNTHSTV